MGLIMTNFIEFLKIILIGEGLILISAIPHFFIRRLPPKVIGITCIVFSIIWLGYAVYAVFIKTV